MKQITVDKDELVEALKANRQHHVDTFEQVLEDYKNEAIRQLDDYIDRIRNGEVAEVMVHLPAPENYEAQYDKAIAMVEWEQHDTVILDKGEFDQYVLDNWAWKRGFDETVAAYSSM